MTSQAKRIVNAARILPLSPRWAGCVEAMQLDINREWMSLEQRALRL